MSSWTDKSVVRRSAQTRTTEVLYSSIRRNSDQPESAMDRERCLLRIMPRPDRSSGRDDRPGFRQARGRPVQGVRAPTPDPPMQPSQTGSRLAPVARAALRLRQRLRGFEQAPIGEHRRGLETQVDPRHRPFYGLRVIALHLHRKGSMPAVCLATDRCGKNAGAKLLCPLLGLHATEPRQRYRTQAYPDAADEPEGPEWSKSMPHRTSFASVVRPPCGSRCRRTDGRAAARVGGMGPRPPGIPRATASEAAALHRRRRPLHPKPPARRRNGPPPTYRPGFSSTALTGRPVTSWPA